jgi:5-methyltetrahydropteroyltriglutamate--homocysteine methyltransferase
MLGKLIPTTLVGSYPQPNWLINRDLLLTEAPPRVRLRDIWKVAPAELEEAQNDATLTAIHDQQRAGIDILSDGEIRRESYFNHFANALEGLDIDNPAFLPNRRNVAVPVPRVVAEIKRVRPVQVADVSFLRKHTKGPIKVTIPGAFTMAKLAKDDYYGDFAALVAAYGKAVNGELLDMKAAGADVVQIDEPYLQAYPEDADKYGLAAINTALAGVPGPTVVHLCFGYAYVVKDKPAGYSFLPQLNACAADYVSVEAAQPNLDPAILAELPAKKFLFGCIDLGSDEVETPHLVAERLRGALRYIRPEQLVAAPDCGMKYLSRPVAFAKLQGLADGAAMVRAEVC